MARRKAGLGDRASRQDAAYKRAKAEGYAGRAVYKLQEIDKRFRLLTRGRTVLDLGCWPGSWMQYAAERVGDDGRVVGIDLREVELALPSTCKSFVADVDEFEPQALVDTFGSFDVVLSDMAPKTSGDAGTDRLRSEMLFSRALHIATVVLRPGGHFAAKVFQGGGFPQLLKDVRAAFSECKPLHTKATRTGSPEHYIIGRGLKRVSPSPSEPDATGEA
ncbi:MAG: RlmE family RNA methyltransferase [Myxococcota bacterium]